MIDKLAQASTESLLKLKANIDVILASRLDTELRHGRIASFNDNRGDIRKIRIERINGKTCSGVETGDSIAPGMKWRVGKGQLKVEPIEKRGSVTKLAAPHRPATNAEAW